MKQDIPKALPKIACPNCWTSLVPCFCSEVKQNLNNRRPVLILQHPKGVRNKASSTRLISLSLTNGRHRVGFSWKSLGAALGTEPKPNSKWGVLFVGTKKKNTFKKDEVVKVATYSGKPVSLSEITGIILIDGNWKESKTMWWRNPWLSRLPIIQLNPRLPAKYNQIAREPRKNCLSTLEALVFLYENAGENSAITEGLSQNFDLLLRRSSSLPLV